MAEIPEEILRRSAEAKAKATGRDVEEILAEMKGEAAAPAGEGPVAAEAAETADAAAGTDADDSLKGKAQRAAAALPEHLLRRSAEAKAAALGIPVEQVIAELTGGAAASSAAGSDAPPAAATDPNAPIDWKAAGERAGMPERLLRRSLEAKIKATGKDELEVLAEMIGEIPRIVEDDAATAATAPAPTPAADEPAPAPAAAPAPTAGGEVDWEAAATAAGMSPKLFRRSAEAKAKATGKPIAEIVAELTGTEPAAAPAAAPAPAPAAPAAAPAAMPAAATAVAAPPVAPPEGVDAERLLTMVQAKAAQGAEREPVDKVDVWPHLLAIEFVALLVVLALLVTFSVFQDAPLLELANPNAQPNPSKAPWYFLGLQELLSYFDPQVAGVLIPGMGLAGLAIIPYIDRNPSTKPSDRKFAIMLFTFFVVAAAILTIIGSFYRGKGFNFTFPWRDGIFFDL